MLEKASEEKKEAAFGSEVKETDVTGETILREGKHLHTLRFNASYTAREGHFGRGNRHKTKTAIKEPVNTRL